MWNVRLFYETGINTVNTLDKPERLNNARYLDVPALDILQGEGLASVNVKATRSQVKNADYMKLTDTESGDVFYYVVNGFVGTSLDVQVLSITLDALMTTCEIVGGVDKIQWGDGIVHRHHVAKENDEFGAYTEDDPLLIPSKELEFDFREVPFVEGEKKTIVESTISLPNMVNNEVASVYKTIEGEERTVTVPLVISVTEKTRVELPHEGVTGEFFESPATEYFDYDFEEVQKGVAKVRSLGVESGILSSYTLTDRDAQYEPSDDGRIITILGTKDEQDSGINLEYEEVENKRLLYGRLNSIILASPAMGTAVTFKPEDIIDPDGNPQVVRVTDPRPAGRPYYNVKYFKGEDITANYKTFFRNALPGMEWANAPLVYTGASGSRLNEINYNTNSEEMINSMGLAEYRNYMGALTGISSSLLGIPGASYNLAGGEIGVQTAPNETGGLSEFTPVKPYMDWNEGIYRSYENSLRRDREKTEAIKKARYMAQNQGMMQAANVAVGVTNSIMSYMETQQALESQYALNARRELQNLSIANSVVAPALHFPRSETLRDFLGNGCVVYRYRPQKSDLDKMDRILNMYGYKNTLPLVGANVFTNRSKFNYVQATGVTIIDKRIPKWLREATASQMSAGVRIWHQLPDITAYNPGQNV